MEGARRQAGRTILTSRPDPVQDIFPNIISFICFSSLLSDIDIQFGWSDSPLILSQNLAHSPGQFFHLLFLTYIE